MGISRRIFTREFKLAAVKEVESGKSVAYVARRLEINPNLLHRWRQDLKKNPSAAFSGNGKRMLAESREAELERKIGQLGMGAGFHETPFVKDEDAICSLDSRQAVGNHKGRSAFHELFQRFLDRKSVV